MTVLEAATSKVVVTGTRFSYTAYPRAFYQVEFSLALQGVSQGADLDARLKQALSTATGGLLQDISLKVHGALMQMTSLSRYTPVRSRDCQSF